MKAPSRAVEERYKLGGEDAISPVRAAEMKNGRHCRGYLPGTLRNFMAFAWLR